MNQTHFCPTGERQLTAFLENRLSKEDRTSFLAHSQTCSLCQSEIELWHQLSQLPAASPGPYFKQDFDAMLARESRTLQQPAKPTLVWVAAAAALAIGSFLAGSYSRSAQSSPEITELRQELRSMRNVVAMSLLQQQSAVERLRGVNYSVRLDNPDDGVVAALVQTLRSDSSVDVRLAAADALRRYTTRPSVRQSISDALTVQDSPLVQLALIDELVELRDRQAATAFRSLATQSDLDPNVKTRLSKAIEELQVQ
jgi:hypothetical protein